MEKNIIMLILGVAITFLFLMVYPNIFTSKGVGIPIQDINELCNFYNENQNSSVINPTALTFSVFPHSGRNRAREVRHGNILLYVYTPEDGLVFFRDGDWLEIIANLTAHGYNIKESE